jgi:hypothetical protein
MTKIDKILIGVITILLIYVIFLSQSKIKVIEPYVNKIDSLQKKIEMVKVKNDSLVLAEITYESQIKDKENNINVLVRKIKRDSVEYLKKLNEISKMTNTQTEKYFATRYVGNDTLSGIRTNEIVRINLDTAKLVVRDLVDLDDLKRIYPVTLKIIEEQKVIIGFKDSLTYNLRTQISNYKKIVEYKDTQFNIQNEIIEDNKKEIKNVRRNLFFYKTTTVMGVVGTLVFVIL